MSKFFSKFSKRKMTSMVAVFLVVAIGTPLLTRQFWVYDASSVSFQDGTSTSNGADTLKEVPKEQLVKTKQYAQLMIKYIKAQPASDDPEVTAERFVDLIKYSAIDQEITSNGDLVITPAISYQGGIKYLGEIKNQILVLADGSNDTTKSTLNGISDEIDKSIKIFGNRDYKSDSQGATVKTEFLRLSDFMGSKTSTLDKDNIKTIVSDTSSKLKAFPSDDQQYLAATQLYSESAQAQIAIIGNNQQMVKIAQQLNLQFILQDSTSTVSLKPTNDSGEKNGIVNSAKAADTTSGTPILNTGLSGIKVSVSQTTFDNWLAESQKTLARQDITLDQMKATIAGSAYDQFQLGSVKSLSGSPSTKDDFVKNNGTAFTALATQDKKSAWATATNNIQFASMWSSFMEGYHLPGQGTYVTLDSNYWTKLASAIKDNDPEAVNTLMKAANIDPATIFKSNDTQTTKYLDSIKQQLAQAAAANQNSQGSGMAPAITTSDGQTQQAATQSPESIYNADGSFNEEAQARALANAEGALMGNEAKEIRDEYALLLKGTTEINGKQVPNDQVIAQNTNAIKGLIRNNLTDSYFGQLYLNYLQRTISVQEYDVYQQRSNFCSNNATALANNKLTGDIAKFCQQANDQWNKRAEVANDANQRNAYLSELNGSVSMDPRTGNMVYTTPVVYFDKGTGKPNIAGSIVFDPVTNQVSGDLTKSFGNSRVTLFSDAFTGEVYLEYSNITKPLAEIGPKGSILTLQTIQISKDGKIGGTFQLFHKLMSYNPNTNTLELKLTKDSSACNLWVNTKGELRGSYNFNIGKSGISAGIIVDSKGNFTVQVNYTANGTNYGSVWIGKNGQVSGQVDLGKSLGTKYSVSIGFDKNGISSVGVPIGGFLGSPFSLSVGRDGGLSFGGFVPIGPIPVPISLGQDQHGNITLSWPGGHWSLGSESRPLNPPVPVMKAGSTTEYDGGTIWYHHSFKKGWKVVRVYNKVEKLSAAEQSSRGKTIFTKYNELLKRNPSISEFLNWYFQQGHELMDGGLVQVMNTGGEQKRNELLAGLMTSRLSQADYSKVVPASAKFPNFEEYKWLQDGKKSEDFPKRPADLLTVNPFDSDVIAKAQAAANNPTNANIAQLSVGGAASQSMSQVTTAIQTSINQDSEYAKVMAQFKAYFNPTAAPSTSTSDSGFIAAPVANSNTNR